MTVLTDYSLQQTAGKKLNADGSPTVVSGAPSLSAALNAADAAQNASSDSGAYTLNLSDAARNFLSGNTANPANATDTPQADFKLTPKQQQTLDTILAKYKDAPYTQATFDLIQDDLEHAGISPDQLAIQHQASNLTGSTQTFIDALNGKTVYDPNVKPGDTSNYETQKDDYTLDIISQWQDISSTYAAATSGETEGATAAG